MKMNKTTKSKQHQDQVTLHYLTLTGESQHWHGVDSHNYTVT